MILPPVESMPIELTKILSIRVADVAVTRVGCRIRGRKLKLDNKSMKSEDCLSVSYFNKSTLSPPLRHSAYFFFIRNIFN